MENKWKNKNWRKIILGVAGGALIIAFGAAAAVQIMRKTEPKKSETINLNEQNQTSTPTVPSKEKTPPKYEGEVTNENPKKINGNIVTKRIIGDNLVINVMIRELVSTGGKCELELELKRSEKKIKQTVQTKNDASTAHCESFQIPRSKLTPGTWEIDIDLEAGGKEGEIKDEVIIQ